MPASTNLIFDSGERIYKREYTTSVNASLLDDSIGRYLGRTGESALRGFQGSWSAKAKTMAHNFGVLMFTSIY